MMTKELFEEYIAQRKRAAVWAARWKQQWAFACRAARVARWCGIVTGTLGNVVCLFWLDDIRPALLAFGAYSLVWWLASEWKDALIERHARELDDQLRQVNDWIRRASE